jgi:23S rRNA (uracil1939-C5)-methyltransferase
MKTLMPLKTESKMQNLYVPTLTVFLKTHIIGKAEIVVVDPPRKGLSPGLVSRIAAAGPHSVAYMSCDPDTLARDCRAFSELGYKIGTVTPIDMFPRTGHVETVVLITRVKE